ncbi:MAG TPA: DUF6629 family protein [Rhizomicrobium sp.]|nr:DUF6629 family protein [Rhizomicrobium sp.]
MCFSATASFTTSAVTGAVGIAAISRTTQAREIPIAVIPLVFATQQAAEGMLWLGFAHSWAPSTMLFAANLFVLIALAFWPVWSPLAVGAIERQHWRRGAMLALVPIGLALAAYSTRNVFEYPIAASVVRHSICYTLGETYPVAAVPAYMLCTIAPWILSSESLLRKIGGIVAIGAAASLAFFYASFVSVWCFFAAATSIGIYAFFHQRRSAALSAGPAPSIN